MLSQATILLVLAALLSSGAAQATEWIAYKASDAQYRWTIVPSCSRGTGNTCNYANCAPYNVCDHYRALTGDGYAMNGPLNGNSWWSLRITLPAPRSIVQWRVRSGTNGVYQASSLELRTSASVSIPGSRITYPPAGSATPVESGIFAAVVDTSFIVYVFGQNPNSYNGNGYQLYVNLVEFGLGVGPTPTPTPSPTPAAALPVSWIAYSATDAQYRWTIVPSCTRGTGNTCNYANCAPYNVCDHYRALTGDGYAMNGPLNGNSWWSLRITLPAPRSIVQWRVRSGTNGVYQASSLELRTSASVSIPGSRITYPPAGSATPVESGIFAAVVDTSFIVYVFGQNPNSYNGNGFQLYVNLVEFGEGSAATASASATPTGTGTPSPSPTLPDIPAASSTPTPTGSDTSTPSPSGSDTSTPTPLGIPSASPSPTGTDSSTPAEPGSFTSSQTPSPTPGDSSASVQPEPPLDTPSPTPSPGSSASSQPEASRASGTPAPGGLGSAPSPTGTLPLTAAPADDAAARVAKAAPAIAGGVIGGLLLLCLLAGAVALLLCRRARSKLHQRGVFAPTHVRAAAGVVVVNPLGTTVVL